MARCPRSLTSRVMVFVAMAISISLLALGSFLQNAIEQHFIEQDADELQVVAQAVTKVLTSNRPTAATLPSNLSRAVSGHHGIYFQVAEGNNILYTSPGANLDILRLQTQPVTRISRQEMYTWNVQDKYYRGCRILVSLANATYNVSVATEINFHLHFLESFNRTLWLIMAIAGAVTLLAAWLGVRQGLLPLQELSQHIRDIQADRLQTRLDIHCVPVELKELVVSFNQMIGQLEEGFERLSNFSDDIAHELRTPLTNLIGQTQVALTTPRSPEAYRELLLSNLEEQERLAKMVSDMLWLAQTERGLIKPVFEPLQLATEIRLLFDFFDAWASDRQITLTLSGTVPTIAGDRSMLRRAFSNLIANAIRHTPMHGSITVSFHTELHAVRIEIMNTGSCIPPEHVDRIFDRFYRIDPARQRKDEGAGLGLAIVKSIVQVHEGSIYATSDKSHTTFTIILPLYKQG